MEILLVILLIIVFFALISMDEMTSLALFVFLMIIGGGITDMLFNHFTHFIKSFNIVILIILFVIAIIIGMIAGGALERTVVGVTAFLAAYPTLMILYSLTVGVIVDSYKEMGFVLFLMFGWAIIIVDIIVCAILVAISLGAGVGIPYLITNINSGKSKMANAIALILGLVYAGVLFYFAIEYLKEFMAAM